MTKRILIVDDQADIRMHVRGILKDEGYKTYEAHHDDSAFAILNEKNIDLVLLDIWLEGSKKDGMEILKDIHANTPNMPIIMISGHGTIEMATQAIKDGAYDFIEKPFKTDRLLHLVERGLERATLKKENMALKQNVQSSQSVIEGHSSAIQAVRQIIDKTAQTNSRIMILGEGGTGKSMIARKIHAESHLSGGAFITLNCSSLEYQSDENPLMKELVGYFNKKTKEWHEGLLKKAENGTLFIDEVSHLDAQCQSALLRILQTSRYHTHQGKQEHTLNCRIISSSQTHIQDKMSQGVFKQDLYYRLNVVPIAVPSLNQRSEDIDLLTQSFSKELASAYNRSIIKVADDALAIMQSYSWPGNMRQLRNVVEWFYIMSDNEVTTIGKTSLPADIKSGTTKTSDGRYDSHSFPLVEVLAMPLRQARMTFEREYLASQIKRFGGNVSRTANFIGMERSALHRKLKSLGLYEEQAEEEANETPLKQVSSV